MTNKIELLNVEDQVKILKLKAEAEAGIKAFKTAVAAINAFGFNVQPQGDDTVYVFRNNIEAYGTLYKMPEVKTPAHLAAVNN